MITFPRQLLRVVLCALCVTVPFRPAAALQVLDSWNAAGTNATALINETRAALPLVVTELDLTRKSVQLSAVSLQRLGKRTELSLDRLDVQVARVADNLDLLTLASVRAANRLAGLDADGAEKPWYKRPVPQLWLGLGVLTLLHFRNRNKIRNSERQL